MFGMKNRIKEKNMEEIKQDCHYCEFAMCNLAYLCIEEEMTSDEVMKIWKGAGCFVEQLKEQKE